MASNTGNQDGNLITSFFNKLGGYLWSLIPEQTQQTINKITSLFFFKALMLSLLAVGMGLFAYWFFNVSLPRSRTTVVVFAQWWEDELEGEIFKELAAEYESKNPRIAIKLQKNSWREIQQLLENHEIPNIPRREAAQWEVPDLFGIDPFAFFRMNSSLHLAALQQGEEAQENSGEETEEEHGEIIPLISFMNLLFYNIDLLSNAGFDRPPKNQTEFLSYVERIKQSGGVYGTGLALGGSPHNVGRHVLSWIWAAAAPPLSEKEFAFSTKEVTDALVFLNQLNQNIFPRPFDQNEDELLQAFAEGRIGMMIGTTAHIKRLKESDINFGITTIPGTESYAKKPVFPLTEWYLGVNRNSPHKTQARKFAAFLLEKKDTIAAAAYAIPGSGARNRDLSNDDPFYAKAFDMCEAGEMVRELYEYSGEDGIYEIVRRQVELMFVGVKTPEQCAKDIQEEWEALRSACSP